jgi:hypothetical protein
LVDCQIQTTAQRKPQQDLVDAWLLNAFPIAKLGTTTDLQRTEVSHFNNDFQLVVDSELILNCEGAHAAPITFCDGSSKFIVALKLMPQQSIAPNFQQCITPNFSSWFIVEYINLVDSEQAQQKFIKNIQNISYLSRRMQNIL